jgi:3-polyprenyl-4-hydroxybenzoate decarboxylase
MIVRDIPTFLNLLRERRELQVIDAPVDPDLELAEIHRRVIAAGGPALLFTNVKGSSMPVVTNLFGTAGRTELAFGRRPIEFVEQAVRALHELVPPTLGKLWGARGLIGQGMRIGTRHSGRGPVTEVVSKPGLNTLPMVKSWPKDGGSFVTLPLVYTEHPDTHVPTSGMYRVQRHSDATTGMHWQIGKGGGFHHQVAQDRGQDLPVTVLVGGPPALVLSADRAAARERAGDLAGQPAAGRAPAHLRRPGRAPAGGRLRGRLVGRVRPHEVAPEGPFGDHYGYYSLEARLPGAARRHAVPPQGRRSGRPPSSASRARRTCTSATSCRSCSAPLFPVVMPNVVDLWSYGETGYHALAGAVVKERYRREAMSAAFRILGEGQLALTKFLWVLDRPVDLRDPRAVLPAAARGGSARRPTCTCCPPVDGHARLHRAAR